MEKNSFTLRSATEPQASTAVPVERAWNPPVRRIFSSREQLTNQENARQLEDFISRIDDPPAPLHEDSRLHRPFSNTRFGAVPIASTEAPDVEAAERASLPHSQDNLSNQPSLHETRTDRSDSHGNEGSESHESIPDISGFRDFQDVIDSAWNLKQLPEQLQEGFDRMKEDNHNTTSELSKERRRCSRLSRDVEVLRQERSNLSRDVESLRQELDEFREREKEIEIRISNQDKALKVESSNVERLQEENENLKEMSRRDRGEHEKTQSVMQLEINALSKDLEMAKRDIRLKDKFLGQIRRDVKNAKKEFDEEVKRREHAETESNAVKQKCAALQESYCEGKRQWKVLQEENETQVTKLEEVNESQREKISLLEIAVEKQKEATQAVESDLVEMVSFLRRISRAVGQVFHATSIHGCLDVPVTVDFPVSALVLEEHKESYDIFERLVEALDSAPSLAAVLELAHPYDDALKDFFRILVVRLVAQTVYICSRDESFRQIECTHMLFRARLQERRHEVQELRVSLSSQLNAIRQETAQSTEQLCLKARQVEEEKRRVKLELQTERGKSSVIISMLGKFKESLSHEKTTLLDLKEKTTAHYQELKSRISKKATETSSSRRTLEGIKSAIESLCVACSVSEENRKTAEDNLQADMKLLRTALADKEAKMKELMERETDLQKAKNELSSHSRHAIEDEEKRERLTASLKRDIQKLMTEKSEAANKLADAEHALQQMSGTVSEALGAKQEALEALIQEKCLVEQLRSELVMASSKERDQPSDQRPPIEKEVRKVSSVHLQCGIKEGTKGKSNQILETSVEQSKCTPLSLPTKPTSSGKLRREGPEADPCEVDFVPKKKKKRMTISNPRESPWQKTFRSDVSEPTTTGNRSQLQNPKKVLGSKESVEAPAEVRDAPSKSAAARDEEWDIELVFGKGEG